MSGCLAATLGLVQGSELCRVHSLPSSQSKICHGLLVNVCLFLSHLVLCVCGSVYMCVSGEEWGVFSGRQVTAIELSVFLGLPEAGEQGSWS